MIRWRNVLQSTCTHPSLGSSTANSTVGERYCIRTNKRTVPQIEPSKSRGLPPQTLRSPSIFTKILMLEFSATFFRIKMSDSGWGWVRKYYPKCSIPTLPKRVFIFWEMPSWLACIESTKNRTSELLRICNAIRATHIAHSSQLRESLLYNRRTVIYVIFIISLYRRREWMIVRVYVCVSSGARARYWWPATVENNDWIRFVDGYCSCQPFAWHAAQSITSAMSP